MGEWARMVAILSTRESGEKVQWAHVAEFSPVGKGAERPPRVPPGNGRRQSGLPKGLELGFVFADYVLVAGRVGADDVVGVAACGFGERALWLAVLDV